MRKHWLIPAVAVALAAAAMLVLAGWASHPSRAARADDYATMDAISIDMDPSAAPANTATSIGSREFCARVNENDTLDADEDAVDTLEIDVTTGPVGVPAAHAMLAFQVVIDYPAGQVEIVSHDSDFLLAHLPGSEIYDPSGPLPDVDGRFYSSALDMADLPGEAVDESGPGVLSRIGLAAADGAAPGTHVLIIDPSETVYMDRLNDALFPVELHHGVVAIDAACPPTEPSPGVTPRPTPGLTTPIPTVTPLQTPYELRIDSAAVLPGGTATVALRTQVDPPGVAAFTIDVHYDRSIMTATVCESAIGLCNPAFKDGQVRFVGAHATGFAGPVEFGAITFQAGPQEGESGVDISVDQITDFEGIDISPWFSIVAGIIRVTSNPATPTPAPIPVPVTTPEPTATPVVLPAIYPPSAPGLPAVFPPTGGPPGAASGWRTSAALAAAGALAAAAGTMLVRRRTR